MKRALHQIASVTLMLVLAGCGQTALNSTDTTTASDSVSGNSSSQLITAQAFPGCGLFSNGTASGYSTYLTYDANALRICRISTPGPYDTDPNTTGNQAPVVNPSYGYLIFARTGTSTATSKVASVGHVWNLAQTTGTNPLLNEESVAGWFNNASATTQIILNGQFFDCTEVCATNTSHSSFPIYSANNYITLGNNASSDNALPKRALCFDSAGGFAAYKTWTLNSTNSTLANVNAAQAGCPNMIVGLNPSQLNQNTLSPRTIIGIKSSINNNDTLCFYVGGYQSRAKILSDLTNFGCTPAVEMDGGNSSELSVRVNNTRTDLVRSWEQPQPPGTDRLVPHAFQIKF